MTSLFAARRRAERFETLVDGGRRDDADRSTADLLELVGALRAVPAAQPRPEFVADLRERLMSAAAEELTVTAPAARGADVSDRLTIKPRRTHRERRLGVALGAVAIVGATTSMAVASQGALPGDALYPVKRAIENTETGFRVGDDAKGKTTLGNASHRLDEVGKLSHRSKPDPQLVTSTLKNFTSQSDQAGHLLMTDYQQHGDAQSIQSLHQFAQQSMTDLSALDATIPPASHESLVNAASSLFELDQTAQQLCPDCGQALLDVPATILAGAAETVGGVLGAVAGGALPGTAPSADPTAPADHGKGNQDHQPLSGLNPPTDPVSIPPSVATSAPATPDASTGGGQAQPTTTPTHDGGGTGGKGPGGKGAGTGTAVPPIDLSPVTDTVNQVVTGVVQGVTGLVGGLLGGLTGQAATPPASTPGN